MLHFQVNLSEKKGNGNQIIGRKAFHVFQHYMKMQASKGGNENMIEESIDVLKCYMLKKINE